MAEPRPPARLMAAGFGAGPLGATLASGVVPLLFLYYLTEYAHVPPGVAGVLLALPKVADLLLDPWLGRRADAWARALGSRSLLLILIACALPVLSVLMFLPMTDMALPLRVAAFGVLLVLQSLMLTVFAVAHTAIASDIAADMAGRSTLMSARALGQTVAGLAVSVLAPQLVSAFKTFHGGYLGMALVLGLASIAASGACWLVVRRVPMRDGASAETSLSLLPALRRTLRNRAFYCVVMLLILLGASSTALFAALPYANQHLLRAQPDNLSLLLTPIFLSVLAGVTAAPWLTRRAPPQTVLGGALLVALAGVSWLTAGARGNGQMIAASVVFGLAFGVLTVLISTLAMEAATKSSGEGESLGMYLGILFSAEKLGQSLGGIVVGFGLDWVGGLGVDAPPAALARLVVVWIGAPVLPLVAALLMLLLLTSRLRAFWHKETVQ